MPLHKIAKQLFIKILPRNYGCFCIRSQNFTGKYQPPETVLMWHNILILFFEVQLILRLPSKVELHQQKCYDKDLDRKKDPGYPCIIELGHVKKSTVDMILLSFFFSNISNSEMWPEVYILMLATVSIEVLEKVTNNKQTNHFF